MIFRISLNRMIKKLLIVLLVGLALFFGWRWYAQRGQTPAAPPAASGPPKKAMAMPVKAAQAKREAIAAKVEAVGDLVAGESVVLRPEITGRISAIRFEEGRKVKAGDVLVELNADEQRSALAQSLSSVQVEQQSFQRIRDVRAKNLISQQQYDESLARLQNAQALLERDKVRLSRTVLQAPFDGIVGLRQVSLGDYVSPGQALVNLESVDPIKLDFKLPEKYAGKVAKGLKLEVGVDAWPGRTFAGEVQAVDPKLDDASRTVRVRARLANADLALKPGLFARLVLDLGYARPALFVPEQAVEAKGSTFSLFRVVDGKAVLTPVKTGARRPGFVEIVEGIKAEDSVVIDGQLKLRDGMPVMVLDKVAP
jgi:membrane fusion protein (multidrug efflux system)